LILTEIDKMAEILEAAAALFFSNTDDKVAHRSPVSNAAFDRGCIIKSLQSDRPAMWIHEMTYAYVLESAHELRVPAILLRARHVAGAAEPIVRAVVECSGGVNWILEGGSKEERDPIVAGPRLPRRTAENDSGLPRVPRMPAAHRQDRGGLGADAARGGDGRTPPQRFRAHWTVVRRRAAKG
jgi:hypothetical protein